MHHLQALVRKQLKAAWRYRWFAILFSWAVCAVGFVAVFRIPNVYEASGRLYVDADAILTPLLRGIAVDTSLQAQVDLLQRTLLSRPNLEKLISNTDLELQTTSDADRTALASRLATEIKFIPQTRNLFVISYQNQSPKLAYSVVQAMLTAFIESKAGNNRTDLENASKFIDGELNMYEQQLRNAERRRAEFRAKYLDVLPQDGGVSRLDAATGQVKSLQGQLEDAQTRRASLTKELAATPSLLVVEADAATGGGAAPLTRLQQAEATLAEMRLRLTDQHPDVIAQKGLIAAMKAGALGPDPAARRPAPATPGAPDASAAGSTPDARGARSVPNPVYEQIKVRLVETESTIASLQRQLNDATQDRDRMNGIVRSAPGLQAEAININRDYDIIQHNYDELLARRESMRISAAAEASADKVKIQIIDPPLLPTIPVAPKRVALLTGALAAGLAAGLGLALLLVQLDQSFHTADDLHDLGYPVVGGITMLAAAIPFFRRMVTVCSFAIAVALPCVIYGGLVLRLIRSGLTV